MSFEKYSVAVNIPLAAELPTFKIDKPLAVTGVPAFTVFDVGGNSVAFKSPPCTTTSNVVIVVDASPFPSAISLTSPSETPPFRIADAVDIK